MANQGLARYYNPISALGATLTTIAAVLFLFFFFLDLAGFHTNPYLGIVTFLMLPAFFVFGLLLLPFGIWRERRRIAHGRFPGTHKWPSIDLGVAHVRHVAIVVLVLTCVNIAIVALAAVGSLEYVDSTGFCTGLCHTPMRPQAVAHQRGVHAGISCASCHVGAGPPGFVKAKLGGVRRLAVVVGGSYERPVPSPVRDLPPAEETCQMCHTPTTYVGDVVRTIPSFSDDEAVSDVSTTLTMHVGGGGWEAGGPAGIHWHASPQNRIEYIATDPKRETIPWVRVTDAKGEAREYVVDGVTPEVLAAGERRVMDCTDCHNRQGHLIAASPERAVDRALALGLLPRTLPFVRREAVAALGGASGNHETAGRQIAERLTTFYTQQHADLARARDPRIDQAVAAAERLYAENMFPEMNVKWGTYPANIGHTDSPGCFRCHDELHKSRTNTLISQDCEKCHRMQ